MALMYLSRQHKPDLWLPHIRALMPELEIYLWPDVPHPERVECALVWGPPPGELARYPNLRMVSSFGAGIEHLLPDGLVPRHLPICRIVDERLTAGMTEYFLLHVLRQHRKLDLMRANQDARNWQWFEPADTAASTISILGIGALGSHAAAGFQHLGFRVMGWSRTPKSLPGIDCRHGPEGLAPVLAAADYLCVILPSTPQTRGIINHETLALMPRGAYLINAGRGNLVVDDHLLAALDRDHLSGATLDVFNTEPLPPAHPYWRHPKVTVTPHNASDSIAASVAPQMVENIRRAIAGQPLLNVVDRDRGY